MSNGKPPPPPVPDDIDPGEDGERVRIEKEPDSRRASSSGNTGTFTSKDLGQGVTRSKGRN